MVCHITWDWRGSPLVSYEVVVTLVGSVTTKGGLAIRPELDEGRQETGRKPAVEKMKALSVERAFADPALFRGPASRMRGESLPTSYCLHLGGYISVTTSGPWIAVRTRAVVPVQIWHGQLQRTCIGSSSAAL